MEIAYIEIQNFRKLKSCRVEISSKETILVGANNSGKTSAMDCMILFLKKGCRRHIGITDFTLSNWVNINQIGTEWRDADEGKKPDLTLRKWLPYLPSMDIWLQVQKCDIHHVVHILPTLDWKPETKLGIRLMFTPRDVGELYKDFVSKSKDARAAEEFIENGEPSRFIWPKTMKDYLDRELHKHFEVQAYILDPEKGPEYEESGTVKPQPLPDGSKRLDREPFGGLFKIDTINAQRWFADPQTGNESSGGFASLSTQLRQYFIQHLDPYEFPDADDVKALQAIEAAKMVFDDRLRDSFKPAISELEGLNYPGFGDPGISLTSRISAADSLDHKAAVQFAVSPDSDDDQVLSLPEQYNGLGYQNLISIVFKLIRFRDEWMRIGKAKTRNRDDVSIEPLHIVLIEEPEAHLHPQAQRVFIKKAYQVLRNNDDLKANQYNYRTQMIVSTHSSHIAHESDFACLRYFRREPAEGSGKIPLATVVNLSNTFGDEDETSKFVKRYVKSTHCDLFFADAAILVEGSAERMLAPHFIRNRFPELNQAYISILEIGGSHAHRLKPLLETLGLLSLIITDLDSIGESSLGKVFPERAKRYRTGNTTIKEWVPGKELLDVLLDLSENEKQSESGLVRVAYQIPIKIKEEANRVEEVIPYTFEDSLALSNTDSFKGYQVSKGLLKKLVEALNKESLHNINKAMFEAVTGSNASKAELALELLCLTDPQELEPPNYILNGLKWLETKLHNRKQSFTGTRMPGGGNVRL